MHPTPRNTAPTLCLGLLLLTFSGSAWASSPESKTPEETTEETAVLATVEKLFDAIAARDGTAIREVLVPEGPLVALRRRDGAWVTSRRSPEDFAESLPAEGPPLLERMWDAEVRLDGPLATVWAPYDFHVGGELSHCGVDAFQLLRIDGVWKIAATLYTAYPAEDCAESPLGAPSR